MSKKFKKINMLPKGLLRNISSHINNHQTSRLKKKPKKMYIIYLESRDIQVPSKRKKKINHKISWREKAFTFSQP